jgi:hypothetical protein
MRQPSRRAFLETTAALSLGVAGCLGRNEGGASPTDTSPPQESSPATSEPTPTATAEAATPRALGTERVVDGASVTVSNLAVQDSVLYYDTPDSMAVTTPENERYVLADVSGSESGPPPTAFALVVGDERYRGSVDGVGVSPSLADRGPKYDPSYGTGEGWVAFLVPPELDASEARVVVDTESDEAAWRVGPDVLDALRQPKARFELRTVEIPETIRPDREIEARVVAENVSDVAGVFRGVLNVAGLVAAYAPYPFELDADPGETVTWEKTFDERPPESVDSVGFFLYTVAGDREVNATVASGTTVTTSGTETASGTTGNETATTTETATGSTATSD